MFLYTQLVQNRPPRRSDLNQLHNKIEIIQGGKTNMKNNKKGG